MRKKVVVITTGGTIAMKADPETGKLVPAVSGADLAAAVPGIGALCDIEVHEACNIASCAMTPEIMFRIHQAAEAALARPDVAGVAITHGTDTVEDTAYLLDLLHAGDKPIVLTAAMRGASDTSPDGPMNIYCAVKTAASDEARGLGVLVLLNEEIHAAAQVRKTHSANPATFASPWWGPIGYCDADRVVIRRKPVDREVHRVRALTARVDLIAATPGADRAFIDQAVAVGCRGIVIQGFGRGNIPPPMEEGIRDATDKGVAVVITTRALAGRPYAAYGYPGSIVDSRAHGAARGGELSGSKTRIKLMVLLSENPSLARNRDALEALLDN